MHLFINGLDLTIVGHYSFSETAYYAIASVTYQLYVHDYPRPDEPFVARNFRP